MLLQDPFSQGPRVKLARGWTRRSIFETGIWGLCKASRGVMEGHVPIHRTPGESWTNNLWSLSLQVIWVANTLLGTWPNFLGRMEQTGTRAMLETGFQSPACEAMAMNALPGESAPKPGIYHWLSKTPWGKAMLSCDIFQPNKAAPSYCCCSDAVLLAQVLANCPLRKALLSPLWNLCWDGAQSLERTFFIWLPHW